MMESDVRFFRRRAAEEFAAADRAVTPAARDRRLRLAQTFLVRLEQLEARGGWETSQAPSKKHSPMLADAHMSSLP